MNKTSIQWCDYTTNPIRPEIIATGLRKGWFCTKVSPGCRNCYAERMNQRCTEAGAGIGNRMAFTRENEAKVRFVLDETVLRKILTTKAKPGSRVFVADMTDLFHPLIGDELIDPAFAAMALRPDLTFMILTKRPQRFASYFAGYQDRHRGYIFNPRRLNPKSRLLARAADWPLPNVQLGVTCENQATADERIPHLLDTPADVRFISYEPAVGPVDFSPYLAAPSLNVHTGETGMTLRMLDGMIAGGESGPGARPAHPDWFRSVRDQCAAAHVPFFFKQWGEWCPLSSWSKGFRPAPNSISPQRVAYARPDGAIAPVGQGVASLHDSVLMTRIGKPAAGRLLDGRTHDELPGVMA